MTQQPLDYYTAQPPRHSRWAIYSLALSIAAALSLIALVFVARSSGENSSWPEVIALFVFVLALVGFIMGLISLRQPNTLRTFAYVGTVQNACILLLMGLGVA